MEINFHQKYLSFPEYYKSNMQPLDINVLHNTSIPLRYLFIQIIHYSFSLFGFYIDTFLFQRNKWDINEKQ